MGAPNYFLYIVGREGKEDHLSLGNYVGPGIQDAPFGVMYVMSAEEVFALSGQRRPNEYTIKSAILKFYGVE